MQLFGGFSGGVLELFGGRPCSEATFADKKSVEDSGPLMIVYRNMASSSKKV